MVIWKDYNGRFMSTSHLHFIMTIEEYIQSELRSLAKPIQHEDIGNQKPEEAIYAKVMSKKFRKLKADDEVVDIVKESIRIAVEKKKPLPINFVFGGNKLWRLDESPEIDWAELFSLIYYLKWMKYIASVHKPGTRLEYYSEDIVLEVLNNLPPSETDQYSKTFKELLAWIQPHVPEGVTVTYRRYEEDYNSKDEFYKEVEEAKQKVTDELKGKLPTLNEEQKVATELNVRPNKGQTDDPLWREKVELVHQAIERTETAEKYFYDPQYIPACPTYYPACLATGSTKKSLAKFWVGVGAVEKSGDSYNALVLTPKQLEKNNFEWQDVDIVGLPGKNFKRIRVLSE